MLSRDPDQHTPVLLAKLSMQLAADSGNSGGAEFQGSRRDSVVTTITDDSQDNLLENGEKSEQCRRRRSGPLHMVQHTLAPITAAGGN